jgi:hypothetical protein
MSVGMTALHNGRIARIVATSGTDHQCIVQYMDEVGGCSRWISQDEVFAYTPPVIQEVA